MEEDKPGLSVLHPNPAPRPPTTSSLLLERVRMIEQSLDEATGAVRAARTHMAIDMEEIRHNSQIVARASTHLIIALYIIAALLGMLVAISLLK